MDLLMASQATITLRSVELLMIVNLRLSRTLSITQRSFTVVIWESVLSLFPYKQVKTLESSILETRLDNDAIKAAAAQNEVVPGSEVRRGTHLKVA
jgi:hypothetical protein